MGLGIISWNKELLYLDSKKLKKYNLNYLCPIFFYEASKSLCNIYSRKIYNNTFSKRCDYASSDEIEFITLAIIKSQRAFEYKCALYYISIDELEISQDNYAPKQSSHIIVSHELVKRGKIQMHGLELGIKQ